MIFDPYFACNKYDVQPEQAEGFIKFFSVNLREAGIDVKPTADGGYVAVGTSTDEFSQGKECLPVSCQQS